MLKGSRGRTKGRDRNQKQEAKTGEQREDEVCKLKAKIPNEDQSESIAYKASVNKTKQTPLGESPGSARMEVHFFTFLVWVLVKRAT